MGMAQITVLRPDFREQPRQPLVLAPRRELPDQVVIGLVANGKPLAAELLRAVAGELEVRLGHEPKIELIQKPNPAYPITVAQADGMAARAHLVITGVGD
jgi:hypothetical protein